MKGKNQSFSFMMELIIVIFFFALSTTVCISFLVKGKTNGWSYDSKCYVRNAKYD